MPLHWMIGDGDCHKILLPRFTVQTADRPTALRIMVLNTAASRCIIRMVMAVTPTSFILVPLNYHRRRDGPSAGPEDPSERTIDKVWKAVFKQLNPPIQR